MPLDIGRYLGEVAIENWLKRNGFEVIYPETLALSEQIASYQGASEIIIAGGSALNCFQLLANLNVKIALVQRRSTEDLMINWKSLVKDQRFFNAIDWEGGFRNSNLQVSTLDPVRLINLLSTWTSQNLDYFDIAEFFDFEFNDFIIGLR